MDEDLIQTFHGKALNVSATHTLLNTLENALNDYIESF